MEEITYVFNSKFLAEANDYHEDEHGLSNRLKGNGDQSRKFHSYTPERLKLCKK